MAKYDKKAALKIMIEAVKQYEEKLNDKQFLIIYREGKDIKTVNVGFRDMNFLHMTGVKTRLSAQQFYAACLESKLSEYDFEIDNKGKVQQKLMVLPYLPKRTQPESFSSRPHPWKARQPSQHVSSTEKDQPAGTPLPDTHVLSDTLNPLQVSPGYMKYTLRASEQAG